ncbi:hypothetical protein GCM10023185_00480 [Hymenobacter saemangeumensis]|uniref:Uncharacterized protein n=1 Tax=Hymenobacter saemangeumensis TaxID=1084522 RepID=A0ABP8HWQ8_9BACT
MNQAHLHQLLNHSPILASLFGLVVLLIALLKGNAVLTRTGLVTLLVAALLAVPVQLTGEGAEEIVEDRPGVTHALIHAHEEAAEAAFWAIEVTGALAMLSLLMLGRQASRAGLLSKLTLAGALLSFGLLARAGNLGGQIMHPETRHDVVSDTLGH